MLPNPNLVPRLVEQRSHVVEARGRRELGWPKPPAPDLTAVRQWAVTIAAVVLAALSRGGRA